MSKLKSIVLILLISISFSSKSLSIEADVFVQSTVNRAANTLSGDLSKVDTKLH